MRTYAETTGTATATASTTMASGSAQMLAPQGGRSVRHCAYNFFGTRDGLATSTPARVGDAQGFRPVWLEVGELPRPTQCAGASYRATDQWSIPRKVQKHYILSCRVLRNPAARVDRGCFLLTCAISYLFVKHFCTRAAGASDQVRTSSGTCEVRRPEPINGRKSGAGKGRIQGTQSPRAVHQGPLLTCCTGVDWKKGFLSSPRLFAKVLALHRIWC